MNLIVNADKNWGIGKNNELLVHIPNDMKMFRQMTTGKVVVMGRKTLESFPNGMPLPKRTNIVLTHDKDYDAKGAIVVGSKEELLDAKVHPENHQSLTIRVAGYTAYFVELAGKLQDEIIERTTYESI